MVIHFTEGSMAIDLIIILLTTIRRIMAHTIMIIMGMAYLTAIVFRAEMSGQTAIQLTAITGEVPQHLSRHTPVGMQDSAPATRRGSAHIVARIGADPTGWVIEVFTEKLLRSSAATPTGITLTVPPAAIKPAATTGTMVAAVQAEAVPEVSVPGAADNFKITLQIQKCLKKV